MRPLTLGDKLLLTLTALLVLEAGVRGYVEWDRDSQACRKQFMRTGRDHVRNVAYTAREALARGDKKELEEFAELLRTPEDGDLVYVAFYGPDGNLVASKTWHKTGIPVPHGIQPVSEPLVDVGRVPGLINVEHYAFLFPVAWSSPGDSPAKPVAGSASPPPLQSGTVVAVRSYEAAKARTAGDQVTVLIVTAAMLAVCLNVLLIFARRLLEPIQALVRATERIATGDFSTPIDVGPRRDELRALADSFNRMVRRLGDQREQILQHSRELERKVSERTAELVQANLRLRETQAELVQAEKMRMLGQLAAGVAHEINTPTGAILNVAADCQAHLQALVAAAAKTPELPGETRQWLAEVLPKILSRKLQPSDALTRARRRELEQVLRQRGLAEYRRVAALAVKCGLDDPPADERVFEHLAREGVLELLELLETMSSAAGITRASAEKIARIVRALRLYTRGEQAEIIEADVNETIDNTLAILQNRIKHAAEVRTDYGKDLPPIRCGADISQVWTNLLNNACDAIEEASPDRRGRIDIATDLAGDRVRVTIFNTGESIPDAIRERIFDPFFTTKPAGKGTGLGLSICAGILRECGGTIRTWNESDGVAFEVTMAAADRKPPEEPVAAGASEGRWASRNPPGDS